jgi:hypothetical protein
VFFIYIFYNMLDMSSNNRFFQLLTMAEAGTLQSQQANLGPWRINPLYFREADIVGQVAVFAGIVSPMILEGEVPRDEIRVTELVGPDSSARQIIQMRKSLQAAANAGLLKEHSGDNKDSETRSLRFSLTRHGSAHLVKRPVYVPELYSDKTGCLMTISGMVVGISAGVALTHGDVPASVLTGTGGMLGGWASGATATHELTKLQNDRAAYKFNKNAR